MASNTALNALGHAVSGSAGTAISTAALYPLDLVTTRLKAQRGESGEQATGGDGIRDAFRAVIRNEGGLSALYSGLAPDVAKSVVDSFLFFGFYNYLRGSNRQPRILHELAIGALAGAAAKAITAPISNVVAQKQISSGDESLRDMLATIRKQAGLLGLWSGYSATLVLTINPSITFFVNRRLAARVIPALEEEDVPVAWAAFLLAAISKVSATALTYPFQTAKTRIQMAVTSTTTDSEPSEKSDENRRPEPKSVAARILALLDKTIFGVILRMVKREGLRALYDGLQGELLKSFFSHGLTMLTKGVLHRLVIRLWYMLQPHLQKRRLAIRSK